LKQDGRLIASIPNIAHYRIIKMLRRREWNYSGSGILDRGHLRFFTIKSIEEMFKGAGLKIIKVEHKISASNLRKALKRIYPYPVDFITEQYIIVAQR
jgi:hypothetical protein